jgi:multiple sugar transport system ATP-binding protein
LATLEFRDVRKVYRGEVVGVERLNLEVRDGELIALVGPSGCGKSTTLNLLAGLESVSAGEIRIDGVAVQHRSPRDRDIAMVFQSYALYPHLTVEENLAFPLKVAKTPATERVARVLEIAQRLQLEALLKRRPRELSGGQRQRVALGRTLVRRPKVFLFDEPLSNLDAALRAQVRQELKALHSQLRATFVYVTHDQIEAMTLADRVVLMKAGRVQQVGPPRELYDAPTNPFVAEFFGTPRINWVPPALLGITDSRIMQVGVRPEDVHLDATPGATSARVLWVEPVGAETWVTLELDGARITARAAPNITLAPGQTTGVRFTRDHAHCFDAQGARVC